MLNGGTEWPGEGNVDWRNRAPGEGNVAWRYRVDWRGECLLEEQSVLERGVLTGGTGWTGELNVDWKNRMDWREVC